MTEEKAVPKSEKSLNFILGLFLVIIGVIGFLLNFSLLPVIGFILGIPCIAIGFYFMIKHKRRLSRQREQKG